MNRLKSTCGWIISAACIGFCGQSLAAEDLVIPGDSSRNLLDKVPLQIADKIEWNKSEKDKRFREKVLRILEDAELFIEMPEAKTPEAEQTAQNKTETHPEGHNGEVP
ncbi:MAG: hypothetical protein RJB13_1009 [Pseudomonadota bacterium]|jgi:hypothetical protein